MSEDVKYDAFIAYASIDAQYARQLHAVLSAIGLSVFFDREALLGGDSWPDKIRSAQQQSLLTLVLISDRVDSAYFQNEEILNAIDLARDNSRRVVPIYLTGHIRRDTIRSPLKQLHGIDWEEGTSLLSIAQRIESALRASRQPQDWPHQIVAETVIIVTGCHHLPEIFDRPSAYDLKAFIDRMYRRDEKILRSVVMGDYWFVNHSDVPNHQNLISLGSSGVNGVTGLIANSGRLVRSGKRWQILRDARRWALFGDKAEDTYEAVRAFKERDLPGFLGEIWPPG